jgi:cardiolipin synthase
MPLNIPNALTWARIALIPFFVGIYYLPDSAISAEDKNLVATVTFVAAAVTDWFDGYLARTLGQTSAFGAFLDPVADKLMVAAALIVLVHLGRVDALIALVIIGREITISALREWMAKVGAAAAWPWLLSASSRRQPRCRRSPLLLYQAPVLGFDGMALGTVLIYVAAR